MAVVQSALCRVSEAEYEMPFEITQGEYFVRA